MKNLKHIKIFEAFESNKLSKTLGYMDSTRDKESFLDKIKRICNIIDFPYSELSDEYFDYLPFSSALKKADIITDEPCGATSYQAYPEYAVDGAICSDTSQGKIKRKWGNQVRNVACPICNGTGVKPKKGEPKLVKFWFNKDGKYIETTCVDGIIRKGGSSFGDIPLPQNDNAYTNSGERETGGTYATRIMLIRTLQTGQYVRISINRNVMYAYIINEGRGSVYAIQPNESGSSPNNTNRREWQKIARNSWAVGSGEFQWVQTVSLNNMDEDDAEPEADPYTWNTGLNFNYSGILSNGRNIENSIKMLTLLLLWISVNLKNLNFKPEKQLRVIEQKLKRIL